MAGHPTYPKRQAALLGDSRVRDCMAIDAIAPEFWPDIRENCGRCRGEGDMCLASEVARLAAESEGWSLPAPRRRHG